MLQKNPGSLMNKEHFVFSCRRFLISGVAAATTTQLQHAPSALGLAAESGACKLAAEQQVGPYYVAEELLRSDISEGKPGVPLSLRIVLLDAHTSKRSRMQLSICGIASCWSLLWLHAAEPHGSGWSTA